MATKPSDRAIKIQGNKAEKSVSNVLHSLGKPYYVYDNVMLKTKSGTTQIDHVVISNYGIFVIETKSHKGMIFGDCNGKNWTQVLFNKSGVLHYQFYSPYLQNYGHLKNISKQLGVDWSCMLGLIVFTSDSVNLTRVQCPCAIHISCLLNVIKSYTVEILTTRQVCELQQKLKNANCQSKYRDRKHVAYVKGLRQ